MPGKNCKQVANQTCTTHQNKHKICAQLRKIDRGKQIDGNYENVKKSKKISSNSKA